MTVLSLSAVVVETVIFAADGVVVVDNSVPVPHVRHGHGFGRRRRRSFEIDEVDEGLDYFGGRWKIWREIFDSTLYAYTWLISGRSLPVVQHRPSAARCKLNHTATGAQSEGAPSSSAVGSNIVLLGIAVNCIARTISSRGSSIAER